MEQMFEKVLATIEKAGTVVTGAAAIENAKARQPRRFISDTMFSPNDIVEIPALTDSEYWVDAPAVVGGDPVFGPLCRVVSTLEDGSTRTRVQRSYLGNFLKELRDRDTNEYRCNRLLDASGAAITFDDCADQVEQWTKLAGRKFKVTSIDTVKTVKRHRKTMVLYDADGTLTNWQEIA